jgi:Raf kinase inhibitor-like YbhB/YbcL family protein
MGLPAVASRLSLNRPGPAINKYDPEISQNERLMMKRLIASVVAIAAMSIPAGLTAQSAPKGGMPPGPPRPGLTLTTTAFDDGGIIPNKYTKAAAPATPISPPLAWSHVPDGTVSFALIVRDPDQPLNHRTEGPQHWLIFNIPATATGLAEGVPSGSQLPDGSMQLHNFPRDPPGWVGPGAGAEGPYHHYLFELFALDTKLSLAPDATRADLEAAMQGHILGKGVLVGRFHRP